jgi:hypothetical protein
MKFLTNNAGVITEVSGQATSAGAGDAGKIVQLDGTGRLDNSLLPPGIGADTAAIQASEALSAGDVVNVHDVSGAFRVRKADATTSGKEAHGFVLAAVLSGASATVYFEGSNTQVSGLTPGVRFLSTTPGMTTSTAPSAAGNVVQTVGLAVSATVLNFDSGTPIVLV